MAQHYTEIAFTPSVKAAQERFGSRAAYSRDEEKAAGKPVALGEREIAFIESRDSFYQATVSDTGWPYVQFRGGPQGFLKVLDGKTIGYADFRGNVQYVSVGNMTANDRVALILMDYAYRLRLKVWARARLVHPEDDADLVAKLEVPTYRARVERAVLLDVEAFDWNCPQHITPRFTAEEVAVQTQALHDRIAELEAQVTAS